MTDEERVARRASLADFLETALEYTAQGKMTSSPKDVTWMITMLLDILDGHVRHANGEWSYGPGR